MNVAAESSEQLHFPKKQSHVNYSKLAIITNKTNIRLPQNFSHREELIGVDFPRLPEKLR